MANADPAKTVNGKKLVLFLGIGSIVFTLVMCFGTYFLANVMNSYLQKRPSTMASQRATPVESHQKISN